MPDLSTFEPIGSITVSGNAGTVKFSSIPTTFTDLYVTANIIGLTGGGSLIIKVNNSTTSIYNTTYIFSGGASVTTATIALGASGWYAMRLNHTTGGGGYMWIMDYSNTTKYKLAIAKSAGNEINMNTVGNIATTSAITSMEFFIESGSLFNAGSTINLYGITKA
jgi:hypothetical protein